MIEIVIITFLVSAALSLILEIVPGAAHLWHKTPYKRAIIFVVFLLLPILLIGAQCFGYDLRVGATCENGFSVQLVIDALIIGLTAFAGSQLGYTSARTSGASLRSDLEWGSVGDVAYNQSAVFGEPQSFTWDIRSGATWNGTKTDVANEIDDRLDQLNDDLQE